MQVTLLYSEGCPNWEATYRRLESLAGELGFDLDRRTVDTPEEAEQLAFRGSPTVMVDGLDPFSTGEEPVGLSCRLYATDEVLTGAPTEQQLRDVLPGDH